MRSVCRCDRQGCITFAKLRAGIARQGALAGDEAETVAIKALIGA